MSLDCICPACHDAYIVKCEVIKLKKIIYVCPRCQIAWFLKEEVGNISFVYLNDFLLDQGLSASMDEVVILDPIKFVGNQQK
jgi:hypothetical protein